ncbi:hypothetical protein C8R44DRAFT_616168 [Mycena epipterygia]|nr:hypothetical protein C8R44DRAFT_616168 [Mycena epipterygia]
MGGQNFPLERSWYIGNNVFFTMLYGIQISMFLQTTYYIGTGEGNHKYKMFYIGYSALLTALITIALACNMYFGQAMWIEHRDVAGGPATYFSANIAIWYNTFGTAADVTANILGDGLMLFRCYMFWNRWPWALALPCALYLASVSMGITTTIQSGLPGADFFHGTTLNFGIPWLVFTIVFNVLVMVMIAIRLISLRARGNKVLGKATAEIYTSLLAILVESAVPFTLLGIGYLITYTKEVPESLAFAAVWGGVVSLSPQAIILRVALGKAWNRATVDRFTCEIEIDVDLQPSV